MNKFKCLNCRYNFVARKMPETCPYCDKKGIEPERSAEDIVSEVDLLLKE